MPKPTKLDWLGAINRCLRFLGQQPVNDIDTEGFSEANIVQDILNEKFEEVLERGIPDNTTERTLSPDLDKFIYVPDDALRCLPKEPNQNIVQRGDRLYDLDNATFEFTESVDCEIYWGLEFDDLPYPVKNVIGWRAVQECLLSEEMSDQAMKLDIRIAAAEVVFDEYIIDSGSYNMLNNADTMPFQRHYRSRYIFY